MKRAWQIIMMQITCDPARRAAMGQRSREVIRGCGDQTASAGTERRGRVRRAERPAAAVVVRRPHACDAGEAIRMRIAVVTDSLSRNAGGLFESVRRLAQEMRNLRARKSTSSASKTSTLRRTCITGCRWTCTSCPAVVRRPSATPPAWLRASRAFRPDSIQIHGIWQYISIAVWRASRKLGCPYVVNAHGMLDPWAVRNSQWKKRIAAWLYEGKHLAGAACLRALCPSEADAIRQFGLRNAVCVVPNAIDLPVARHAAILGSVAVSQGSPRPALPGADSS